MMENYTYRGKRQDNQEWIYGFLTDVEHINEKGVLYPVPVEVIASTVCQQIGLCDKNGIDAYYGDVVKFTPKVLNETGSKYVDAWFSVVAVISQNQFRHSVLTAVRLPSVMIDEKQQYHIENLMTGNIIGNIYDNPDISQLI